MTDEQYKALRQLMLEQNSKIAELTLEVRRLSEAVTTTEVVYVEENRVGTEQLEDLLRIRQSPSPHSDNE
ncbi:hypothetical protein [Agrobacterium tumefaciens]|uniref:hypothetical protein n=1 Tax=Agrobacterium tumefaciens TaxID=358 RepID=UPI001AD94970|nr:hypothetical protein [Agrobacterium tumefaciens]